MSVARRKTCRAIAWDAKKSELIESHERRFRRLLAADSPADLCGQLRTWVRLAASKGHGVNYESLFADLWNWRWYADDTVTTGAFHSSVSRTDLKNGTVTGQSKNKGLTNIS